MSIHPSITTPRVLALLAERKRGVCVRCGEDAWDVDADTIQPCRCPRCGELSVCTPGQILGYWRSQKRLTSVTVTAPWEAPGRGVGVHIDLRVAFLFLGILWLCGVVIGAWMAWE